MILQDKTKSEAPQLRPHLQTNLDSAVLTEEGAVNRDFYKTPNSTAMNKIKINRFVQLLQNIRK